MHPLDNPIWSALQTGSRRFAKGTGAAQYFERAVALFAGLRHNTTADLEELAALFPPESVVILFTPAEVPLPACWQLQFQKPLLQMVYEDAPRQHAPETACVPLTDADIPAMLALTALTKPGPFLSRTILFGGYEGIFENGEMVAMAGQRLQPGGYTEVSALCTHPAHTGKGFGARLLRSQVQQIKQTGRTPFLHVYADNPACSFYEKFGLRTRHTLLVMVVQRTSMDI